MAGRQECLHQYARAVKREGNREAQEAVARVFEPGDRTWRGIGSIPASGLHLRHEFEKFNAEVRFDVGDIHTQEHPACIAGQILQGTKTPLDCTAYGTLCSPQKPLGAPMVSAEGVCSAYHAAGRGLAAPTAFPLYELSRPDR